MERVLTGRTAIVTGANQGFGLAVARAFAMAGANLMLCGRNTELLGRAQREIESLATADQAIMAYPADVAKPDDVEKLVVNTLGMQRGLHVLVNNAGIYGPKGLIEEVDWGDWVKAIEINLLGSVLMCRAVLPHLRKNRYGKIIQLSGGGATNPLPRISAYAASKAAVVRFAETLAEEVRDDNIGVNAIAPGALNTRLLDEVLEAGPEKVGEGFYNRAVKQKKQGGAPLQKGADLAIFLASSASDGITGKLISAVWDPWERFPDHLDTLNRSDIYTLRRIVPKDRAQNWGDK